MNLNPDAFVRQKEPPEEASPERMAAVAGLPCCICEEFGLKQLSPTKVHHCIMGRHSYSKHAKKRRRAPDSMTIPICDGHHQGIWDNSKIAIHREPAEWERRYGKDTDWISWTEERLTANGWHSI